MRVPIPLPVDDQARVDRLRALVPDLAHCHVDLTLQSLVEAAAKVCGSPVALVSLVGENEQYFRACVGIDVTQTSREDSFCTWAIMERTPFIIPDARADVRFANNPMVVGEPHIRFYAGVPLRTTDDRFPLGTVCVIDQRPRTLDDAQIDILKILGESVVQVIEREHDLALVAMRAEGLLDSIADCVIATDANGTISYANPAATAIINLGLLQGRQAIDVIRVETEGSAILANPIHHAIENRSSTRAPSGTRLLLTSDLSIEIDSNAAPTFDVSGELAGAVMVFRNVTSERQLARELQWQGTHDALTGLSNRVAFETSLAARISKSEVTTAHDCVLYLDLDRFKGVNDELGHAVGDQLLVQVAQVIANGVRRNDLVARIGGDEFAVLLEECDVGTAEQVANAVIDGLRTLRSAFADRRAHVDASVGLIALDHANLTVEEVLHRADSACYAAKHAGGGRVQVYDPDLTEIDAWNSSVRWMNRLQTAIDEERMRLHAQLIQPLDGVGRPSVEVLVRLIDGDEIIHPPAFMAAAERFRLARRLDRWVVGATLRWLEAEPWTIETFAAVHINLSGQSLGEPEVAREISEMLQNSSVPGTSLCFEITESNAVAELGRSSEFLDQLTALGCQFALDDFGRGFSSFDYLRRFPVSIVKIDGSFVTDLANDDMSHHMLAAIVSVCKTLGKTTIAERVDSDATVALLREMGVDGLQGNHIAEPVPLPELRAKLS